MNSKNTSVSRLETAFQSLLILSFHALFLITPFIWVPANSELFEFPKTFFTYALTLVILFAWIGKMLLRRKIIFKRSYLDLPLGFFLFSQLLSTLFSIDIHTSMFGYYSRLNGGLLSILCYITLYFAIANNISRSQAKRLIQTLIISLSLTSFYSFFEHFGHSFSCLRIKHQFTDSCWVQDVQLRVFGTFGQPNWQAAYIVTLIFLPLSQFISIFSSNSKKFKFKSLLSVNLIFALALLVLIFTKSRSGLLGFATGYTVFFSGLILFTYNKSKHLRSSFLGFGLSSCVILLCLLVFGQNIHPKLDQILNQTNQSSLSSQTAKNITTPLQPIGGTDSKDIRLIVWRGALKLISKHPLLGTGVETFAYAYYGVRPRAHNDVSEWDFLYNKAHNEYLNYAANSGLIGLGTYLLFLFAFLAWTLKQVSTKNKASVQLIAIAAGFTALCVSNFFGFSTTTVNTLLFTLPALALVLSQSKRDSIKWPITLSNPFPALVILGLVMWITLLKLNNRYTTDILYNQGSNALAANNLVNAISLLESSVKRVPDEPLYSDQLSLAYSEAVVQLVGVNESTAAAEFAHQALIASDRTLSQNNVHLNFYKTRTRVFANLASLDPKYLQSAQKTLEAAIKLAPTDAKLYYNLALLYEQANDFDSAKSAYQTAIDLKPNYEAAHLDLGKLYLTRQQPEMAQKEFEYILDHLNASQLEAVELLNQLKKSN